MAESDFSPTADPEGGPGHAATATPSIAGTGPTAGEFGDSDDVPLTALPGFDIEKAIGVGGMGEVYQARQQGLNRTVAIKTVRSRVRVGDKQLIRFLAEAEAVAAVRHPNVVEVYQFGEHRGRPYMVLEFCTGGDLSTHIHDAPADRPRWAAELIAAIADGVGAAHALGIIHRDLKPANVLLAGDGTPKVTDFGLAKRGTGSDLTQTDAILGTPAYMSPEQAGGGTKFVGPESDVWSLGVMLYELVCGERPFTADNALQLVSRVMSGEVPPLRGKCPTVPTDLALIVQKCLTREPRERYATAADLSADLRRWLAGEPILARPPGAVESAVRWARRNPRVAGSVAVAVLALVLGTVVSTCLALFALSEAKRADGLAAAALREKEISLANANRAAAAQARAEEEKGRADDEARQAVRTNTFLRDVFGATDPTGLTNSGLLPPGEAGRKMTAEQLLDRGIELLKARSAGDDSRSERLTRAALLDALGNTARTLGLYEKAGPLLKEAVAIRDELLAAGHKDRRQSRYNLACYHGENGDMVEAVGMFTALLDEYRADGQGDTPAAADVYYRLAGMYMAMEDERAEGYAREAVRIRLKVSGEKSRETALVRLVLAAAQFTQMKTADALATMKPALPVLLGEGVVSEPTVKAAIEYMTGVGLRQSGYPALAVTKLRSALRLLLEALGPNHLYLALGHSELALACLQAGQTAEADASFRDAVAVIRNTIGLGHPKVLTLLHQYASLMTTADQKDMLWGLMTESLDVSEKRYGADVPWRFKLLATAAAVATRCGREKEAAALAARALDEYRRRPAYHLLLSELAFQLCGLSDFAPAHAAFTALLATPDDLWTPAERWRFRHNFGGSLVARGRYAEAEPLLRETCRTADTPAVLKGVPPQVRSFSFVCLGYVEWHAGRHAEAEKLFRDAVALLDQSGTPALVRALQDQSEEATFARDRYSHLIRLLAVRRDYPAVPPLLAKLAKQTFKNDADRGWVLFVQAATAGEGDRAVVAKAVEQSLGKATDPDVAGFRARAVVVCGGDVGREVTRLDALLAQGKKSDHLFLARAACAVALGQSPDPFLANVGATDRPVLDRVRHLLAAVAAHRAKPTDTTRAALEAELGRADDHLAAAAKGTDPVVKGFVVAYLVELNWWGERVRAELKAEKK